MKSLQLLCILIFLAVLTLNLKAQTISYSIKIELSKHENTGTQNTVNDHLKAYSAEVIIRIPETTELPSDTLWFHWPLIAFSQKYSDYSKILLRSGEHEFYFRRPENRAQIIRCNITYDNTQILLNKTQLEDEFIPIAGIKSREIIFNFEFILPEWSYGTGLYKDKIVGFDHFYPRLAYYDGHWHKHPYKGGMRRPYFDQNITLQMPVKKNYHVISNGIMTDSLSNHIVIKSAGTPNLSVFYVRKDVNVTHKTVYADQQPVRYTVVHESQTDMHPSLSADSIQFFMDSVKTHAGKYPLEHLIVMVLKKEKKITYDNGIALIPKDGDFRPESIIIGTCVDENWTHDNYWISDEGQFSMDFFKDIPRYKGDYSLFSPLLTYNDNNKLMLGILYANHNSSNYKKTGYTVAPEFSFRESRIVGEAGMYHDVYIRHRYFDRIRFRSDIKSYFFNHNKDLDYVQQYLRLDPGFELRFRKDAVRGVDSGLSVKSYIIREEEPDFTTDGIYSGLSHVYSYIFRAVYHHTIYDRLSSTHHEWALEQQSYNDDDYLKISATWMKRWMYKNRRNIKVRLFGSGFIFNSQRKSSSYQNSLTRGSIALIHQGFNDYTYDEYFFSRQNQNQLQRHQVSMYQGGGFKTAVGSAFGIGMSNNFALAGNVVMDLPFGQGHMPVQLYFDGGVYSTYEGDKFKNNLMYNGGISIHFKELVYIHIPLIYSENLGNIHREVHKTFWNRMSFSFNLNRITQQKIMFEKFYK